MAQKLKSKVINDPDEMAGPVQTYIGLFNKLKTNAALVSALKTFGKYTGAAPSICSWWKKVFANWEKARSKLS